MEIFKLLGKVKSKYRPVATISQMEIDAARSRRTCWGVPSPNPAHFALCAFFGCAAPYIAPHFRWELVKQQGGTMTKPRVYLKTQNCTKRQEKDIKGFYHRQCKEVIA